MLFAAGIGYMFFGFYDISATQPHWQSTVWMVNQVRDHSIQFHIKGIEPHDLKSQKLHKVGIEHCQEMCRLCHGASGYEREDFAEGLYPKPPDLTSSEIQGMNERF